MTVHIAIIKAQASNERRVALVPGMVSKLIQSGVEVSLQAGAGVESHYADDAYKKVTIVEQRAELLKQAHIVLTVEPLTEDDIAACAQGAVVIGLLAPHQQPELVNKYQQKNITAFALEHLPRTTRAQAMDVLSSQATVAGYKAALLAANLSQRFFPMLTTAAGTIRPASVLVIGAGVAGLQAIATAHRLGAMVHGYDIRPETREQIASLGARFVDTGVSAKGEGGYARELTAEEKQQQQDKLAEHIAKTDVVITTAAIPGRAAPKIISKAMVDNMKTGSVIVDMAAESGGNCELTKAGETIVYQGVTIDGPVNLPSQLPTDASDMLAKNMFNFMKLLLTDDGTINIDWDDDILAKSAITGKVK